MSEVHPFTLSFLKLHPEDAARALQSLPEKEVVEFLQTIPVDLAAKTLELVVPHFAAQCLLLMPPEDASRLMQQMKITQGISFLRFMPKKVTKKILKQMLPEKKVQIRKRLSYPKELVGAWMDFENPAITENMLVGEFKKSLRKSKKEIDYPPCVVRQSGVVAGVLNLTRLITARDSSPVSNIMERGLYEISDRSTVQSVARLPYWDRHDALPVVDGENKFLGMLTRKNLDKALSAVTNSRSAEAMDSVLMGGVEAYISTLSWLVQSMAAPSADIPSTRKQGSHGR